MHRQDLSRFVYGVLALACLATSHAQFPSPQTAPGKLAFEVASVRQNRSGGVATSNFPLDRGSAYLPSGGELTATNQSLVTLLIFAYKINISEFRGGLMRRLPGWAVTDKFDVNARAASPEAGKEDMRLMMQALLEVRFKLKVHREKRKMPVYGLYLTRPGKTGTQLKPHTPTSSCFTRLPPPLSGTTAAALVGLWPATCGDGAEARISKYRLREGGRDLSMNAIANWLTSSGESDRPILDRTGLQQTFDFILEFDPESLDREGVSSVPHADSGPTFTEAVKEQLGFDVRKEKEEETISIFVVDKVEYPTAN